MTSTGTRPVWRAPAAMLTALATAAGVTTGVSSVAQADPVTDIASAATSALPTLGQMASTVDWGGVATAAATAAGPGTPQANPKVDPSVEAAVSGAAVAPQITGAAHQVEGILPTGAVRPGANGASDMLPGSTRPECAATVVTAVPGTFETAPGADPTQPTGLLQKIAAPMVDKLGGDVTVTYVPYAADAAVNGTSYLRSVASGVRNTLATMEDVAKRCPDSKQALLGYSQGADVAGDVATAIGNGRTTVNPDSVIAVVLMADPERPDSSNVLANTQQTRPTLPMVLQEEVKKVVESPTFAQMQMQLGDSVRGLVDQIATQVQDVAGAVQDAAGFVQDMSGTVAEAAGGFKSGSAGSSSSSASATPTQAADGTLGEELSSSEDDQPAAAGAAPTTAAGRAGAPASADKNAEPATEPPTRSASSSGDSVGTGTSSSSPEGGAGSFLAPELDDGVVTAAPDSQSSQGSSSRSGASATTQAAPSTQKQDKAGSTAASTGDDGGLSESYAKSLEAGSEDDTPRLEVTLNPNEKVQVAPITMGAVSGGGLGGQRDNDFGELSGVVAEVCVPGDVVCSLPENSELARSLVQVGKNVSGNLGELTSMQNAHRMVGLLSLQAVNTVADITGLPHTKLSADSLQAIIDLVAGAAMTAAGIPGGAALIAKGVAALPQMLPEVFAQIADIPRIIAGLPQAGENAMDNLGLNDLIGRINKAFTDAGMTSPTQLDKLPEAFPKVLQALAENNSGLLQLATNPMMYGGLKLHGAFDTIQLADGQNAYEWLDAWLNRVAVPV